MAVPAITRLEYHAFTIAASAPGLAWLLVQDAGDWTHNLCTLALNNTEQEVEATVDVLIEGPYDSHDHDLVQEELASGRHVILAAGGYGITAMLPILEASTIFARQAGTNAGALTLIWTVRGEKVSGNIVQANSSHSTFRVQARRV